MQDQLDVVKEIISIFLKDSKSCTLSIFEKNNPILSEIKGSII